MAKLVDVRGREVNVGDTVSIAYRKGNIAEHVIGEIIEISEDGMEFRLRSDTGREGPWRRVFYHNTPHQRYNKLVKLGE